MIAWKSWRKEGGKERERMCVCVCVCVCQEEKRERLNLNWWKKEKEWILVIQAAVKHWNMQVAFQRGFVTESAKEN